jgi:citrate lyase subunit beta/citryl-CoA lyase
MSRLARSYLYVPGNAEDKLPKALAGAADAVIVDLEDAVPVAQKESTRRSVRTWLDGQSSPAKELWVRVNSGEAGVADIRALLDCAALTGLVLAKATPERVEEAGRLVAGTPLLLSPLLETPGAVLDVARIARMPGVHRLQIGEYDLCAEAGIDPGKDESEVAWARSLVVMASAAGGLLPPIAPVSIEIHDSDAFRSSTERSRRQGFVGRACIHPRQVEVAHAVYTPRGEDVDAARAVLDRFGELDGTAVMVGDDGRMVDEATLRSARRVLDLAADQAAR